MGKERQKSLCSGERNRSEESKAMGVADMGCLLAIQDHVDVWAWAAAKGHV